MTHRRLRRLGFLFNVLTGLSWVPVVVALAYDFKNAPVPVWFFAMTLAVPVVFGLVFGALANWLDRQKSALREKWETQFGVVPFLLWAIEGATTLEQREVLRCIWYESGVNAVVPTASIPQRSENSTMSVFLFQCEFLAMLEEGFVSEAKGGFVIGEKVFAMARCRQPLDSFSDSTVHTPFFPRLLQTA